MPYFLQLLLLKRGIPTPSLSEIAGPAEIQNQAQIHQLNKQTLH